MSAWQPLDGTRLHSMRCYDVYAKRWLPDIDRFEHRRFVNVRLTSDTTLPYGKQSNWLGLSEVSEGWFVTHFAELPDPPSGSAST